MEEEIEEINDFVQIAASRKNYHFLNELIYSRANPNMIITTREHPEGVVLTYLLLDEYLTEKDRKQSFQIDQSPLHKILERILKLEGFDPDLKDNQGRTPRVLLNNPKCPAFFQQAADHSERIPVADQTPVSPLRPQIPSTQIVRPPLQRRTNSQNTRPALGSAPKPKHLASRLYDKVTNLLPRRRKGKENIL